MYEGNFNEAEQYMQMLTAEAEHERREKKQESQAASASLLVFVLKVWPNSCIMLLNQSHGEDPLLSPVSQKKMLLKLQGLAPHSVSGTSIGRRVNRSKKSANRGKTWR